MGSPEVRLFADDQLIHATAFEGERMRIGRRPENDLVIEDLAVSRMHAVLIREADGSIVLEDAGSGNGSYLDGERIEGRATLPPGRPVRMGRHVLVWVDVDGAASSAASAGSNAPIEAAGEAADRAAPGAGEAADRAAPAAGEVSLFDFALEEDLGPDAGVADDGISLEDLSDPIAAPELDDLSGAIAAPELDDLSEAIAAPELDDLSEAIAAPEPDDLSGSIGSAELDGSLAPAEAGHETDAAELTGDDIAPEVLDAVVADGALGEDGVDSEDPLVAPQEPALHAGLVVQHSGALLRVVAWEADRMCIGRGDDCEVLLESTGVSRRHALLVRDGTAYEVRDLESINGTEVNGEKVRRRVLEPGDVVRIESFEITFLLDHSPIADEVKVEKAESRVARGEAEGPLDLTLIREFPDTEETGFPTLDLEAPPEPTVDFDADMPPPEPTVDFDAGMLPPEPTAEMPQLVEPEMAQASVEPMPQDSAGPDEGDLFEGDEEVPLVDESLDADAVDPLLVDAAELEDRGDATMLAPELLFDPAEPAVSAPLLDEGLPQASVLDEALPQASVLDESSDEEKDLDEPLALSAPEPVVAVDVPPPVVALDAQEAVVALDVPPPVVTGALARVEDVPAPLVELDAADPMGQKEQPAEASASKGASGTATIGGLVFDLKLSEAELPEALAEALKNNDDGELRIPVELRIRRD